MDTKKLALGVGALACAAALGVGSVTAAFASGPSSSPTSSTGSSTAGGEHDDTPLTGATLSQASAAAIKAAGGGTVTDTQTADEKGAAYEVEVTTDKGQQVEVRLDKGFTVVSQKTEAADPSDKPLTGDTLTRASAAALKATGGGTVTETGASDQKGSAYQVEVATDKGQQVEVTLDTSFSVVSQQNDD